MHDKHMVIARRAKPDAAIYIDCFAYAPGDKKVISYVLLYPQFKTPPM